MKEEFYIKWAYEETKKFFPSEKITKDWLPNWDKTLMAIRKVHGIFETTSLIFSRCSFLGLLYRGDVFDSGWKHCRYFIGKFFKPEYAKLHKISNTLEVNSEIYSVFRNKILHSGQPVGILNNKEIIGWWMGYGSNLRKNHLKIDHNDNLNIHCGILIEDFLQAVKNYADYLKEDKDMSISNKRPSERWYPSFWSTFCPLYYEKNTWFKKWSQLKRKKR